MTPRSSRHRLALLALLMAVLLPPYRQSTALAEAASPVLRVEGDRFLLDGEPFDMWGVRVASATKDQRLTDHLVAQLDDYVRHGVNTVTVFYQGSSSGNYDPFSPDGTSIDAGHQERMEQIIRAAAARRMVVVVGIFYQHAPLKLKDAEAVRRAVRIVTERLQPHRNVIVNIANEQNSGGWQDTAAVYDFQDPQRNVELCRLVHEVDPQRLVGAGGYDHEKNVVIGRSKDADVLLFDTAGPSPDSGQLHDRFVAAGVTDKPLVNVELFGGWTKQFDRGVFVEGGVRDAYLAEVKAAAARPGLYVFFHNNPWMQQDPIRYDLAGAGSRERPGIRWYFEAVQEATASKNDEQRAGHEITVSGTRFLVNGKPFPYTGVSFFNAIYNRTFNKSSEERKQWLRKFKRYGINVLRVWCQWDNKRGFVDAGAGNSMYEPDGTLRVEHLKTLKGLLTDADAEGVVVELALFARESWREDIRLSDEAMDKAVEAMAKELRPHRNVTFQVWNEFDHRVIEAHTIIKRVDPKRLVTNSPGYAGDMGKDEQNKVLDYLTPHTTRQSGAPDGKTWLVAPREIRTLIEKYKKPVVDDEPARNGTNQFGGPRERTHPQDHVVHTWEIWKAGGYATYHHDMFQLGYGSPSVPPSGVPDPEFSPYHRVVFEFLALRERYMPESFTKP